MRGRWRLMPLLPLVWLMAGGSGCPRLPANPSADQSLPGKSDGDAFVATEDKAVSGETHKAEEREHPTFPMRVRLRPDVLAAATVRTTTVVARSLPMTLDLTGEIAADPDRCARITARVPGRIVEVRFKEGSLVKAGTVLLVLESAELTRTRGAYSSARARLESTQKNAERLSSLVQSGLAAQQELAEAIAALHALQAEVQAAQRALLSFGLSEAELTAAGPRFELRAPLEGFAMSRNAIVGQTVTAEQLLCELVNLDRAYFVGRLFERNLASVHVGQPAEVRLNAYPEVVLLGEVEAVARQLDPGARTVVTRIAVKNRDDLLKIGLFGSVRISLGDGRTQDKGLVVPLAAITRLTDRDVVFVRQPDGYFEVHPVTLGHTASGLAQVLTGLRVGEQVVVEGVFTLKSALLKSTLAEEP